MVHVVYDVNAVGRYYEPQTGHGNFEGFRWQRGFGKYRRQSGRGVGGVISKAYRYLVPLFKKYVLPIVKDVGKAFGEEGLEAGQKILSDVAHGADLKDAVVTEGTEALKKLVRRAGAKIQQAGTGKKRKRPAPRSLAHLHLVGRSVLESAAKKKRRGDTLGLY